MKKINIPGHLVELFLFVIVIALLVFFGLQLLAQDTLQVDNSEQVQQGPGFFLLLALIIEAVARLVPTKYDVSILSNLLRLIDKIMPNRYKEKTPDGKVKKGWFRVRHKYQEETAE